MKLKDVQNLQVRTSEQASAMHVTIDATVSATAQLDPSTMQSGITVQFKPETRKSTKTHASNNKGDKAKRTKEGTKPKEAQQ